MSLQLRRLASLLAVLALAPLWAPVPVRADATAQTIIGYADGSMPGVGPIYQVPDTFGGPDPYFIRYPAPVPTGTSINTMGTGTIRDSGPAKTSEPFPPTGPQPLFSNGGLCTDNSHHAFSIVGTDTGSTAYREGAAYVVSMPDKADTNNWRSCTGLAGFNLFTVSLQNSNWSGAIAQIVAAHGWVCGNHYDRRAGATQRSLLWSRISGGRVRHAWSAVLLVPCGGPRRLVGHPEIG